MASRSATYGSSNISMDAMRHSQQISTNAGAIVLSALLLFWDLPIDLRDQGWPSVSYT